MVTAKVHRKVSGRTENPLDANLFGGQIRRRRVIMLVAANLHLFERQVEAGCDTPHEPMVGRIAAWQEHPELVVCD
jgi:hypothetical protein